MSTTEKTWCDDDAFWEAFAPMMFTDRRWDKAKEEVDAVIAMAEIEAGARVLDLACGPGRHSLELARRGFSVTGVDRTRRFLDSAGERAAASGLEIDFVHSDMRDFEPEGSYDLVISLFTSFGYFDDAQNARMLEKVRRCLRPGAAFVIDLMGAEVLARKFQPRDWSELPDGSLLLQLRRITRSYDAMDNDWIHVHDGRVDRYRVTHRLFGGPTLTAELRAAGFNDVQVFGGLDQTPYDHDAERLVALARTQPGARPRAAAPA